MAYAVSRSLSRSILFALQLLEELCIFHMRSGQSPQSNQRDVWQLHHTPTKEMPRSRRH